MKNDCIMKKFFHYILMAAFLGGTVPFTSCSDDEENQLNEWNMGYISLLPVDYLRPIPSFNLTHSVDNGVQGEVSIDVMATLQKPTSADVKVKISATCEGINAEHISVSDAVIKAGATKSEPVTVSITDWSDIAGNTDDVEYTLNIKIAGIETVATEVTNGEFNQAMAIKINKEHAKREGFLSYGMPENSTLMDSNNRGNWGWTYSSPSNTPVENQGNAAIDATGKSDLASNAPYTIVVDFKESLNITGIYTYAYAGNYAPKKVEIYTSEDGVQWTPSLGEVVLNKESQQNITFKEAIQTRYIKYEMLELMSGRVSLWYLLPYLAKE